MKVPAKQQGRKWHPEMERQILNGTKGRRIGLPFLKNPVCIRGHWSKQHSSQIRSYYVARAMRCHRVLPHFSLAHDPRDESFDWQIAREISSSKTGVRQALIRFGIPPRKQGQSSNRAHNLPFGKRAIKGKVVDHEGEKRVIESVLKMHREGLSNCAIARVLTEMKVPTKLQGRKWHHEIVRQIIARQLPD